MATGNYHYVRASSTGRSPSPSSSTTSTTKNPISRPLVQAWKALTSSTRKSHRDSVMPPGFVLVTRRRSVLLA
ncbi:hypothetical protein BD626DRAFT_567449 [Schizophyllum amplum]|uniref:Uncharacterized protein n=1 Tax=Schizophyllum amplum TaxID=97359 RepID=A0A550CLB2_9AGAR|nr:hypothetical protein BD626DRAFT_567449 [Auriculariopsis ampla]